MTLDNCRRKPLGKKNEKTKAQNIVELEKSVINSFETGLQIVILCFLCCNFIHLFMQLKKQHCTQFCGGCQRHDYDSCSRKLSVVVKEGAEV